VIVDQSAQPREGDPACAQVYDRRGGGAETIFPVYDPPYPVAASGSAGLRKAELADDKRVIIRRVITGSFRVRPR
jgi:hypothetical protein